MTILKKYGIYKKSTIGIAFGEHTLQQLISLLDIDMVLDVGANNGQYAIQLRKKIGYRGPIVSFEPIPGAAARIRDLTRHDKLWKVRECAIDDHRGQAKFNIMAGDQFSSLLAPSKSFEGYFNGQHKIAKVIDVKLITLGDAVNEAAEFSRGLLKLDTQGSEMRILKGGVDHLLRFPAVQMEVGFQSLYEGAASYTEVIKSFEDWGYRLCALFPNNEGHFPHLLEMDALFLRNEFFPELT